MDNLIFFLDDYVLHMWPELEPTNSKPDKYKQTTKWFQKKKNSPRNWIF
jgi:hypothetical protein